MGTGNRQQQGMFAVHLGLATNAVLAVLKTGIGIVGHSPALLADGINSTSDVAYGVVVSIFMRLSGKPADREHPYGHDRLESIAAVVIGAFVITTAISIFWSAIDNIYELHRGQSDFLGASRLALWIAGATVIVKIALALWTKRVGDQTRNTAVIALAADHRNDIFSALAATIGIVFGRMGFLWIDPLAGGLVALIILKTGIEIIRQASADLMDTLPGKDLSRQIADLLQDVPGIEYIEDIHGHRFGPYLVINITVGVAPDITVAEGDRIACRIEMILLHQIDFMRRVFVHYHPAAPRPPLGTTAIGTAP
ncbi:cation transporter [Desulfoprunum benzoelyticum]|uniref:Cation diffusion facilitator family transporter n=1 Tax=Desulfoprunum benzoelyticum TaxID=1506996 RepID=A0A840V116_9BACT|nr:cation diffusion facilitator family transporter [Desulfoprunum benzoelyticum]MBB5347399.1 cation diffusion facilitator family transporter [Desulfoprunum benzoelyticum]MBM9530924.1 cation transporter [Desulfoprunum benzoelyticum]